MCTYSRGYRIKLPKRSQKDAVYFRAEDNHETKEKEKKNRDSFKHESKMTFLLIFTPIRGG